jgi:RNA polymerase sigma-70 factor, ECF subfamily
MGAFDEVLAAAREGEGWALSQLYRATYPRFVRYAGAVAPDDAHDVAADAWLDIARSLHRFK